MPLTGNAVAALITREVTGTDDYGKDVYSEAAVSVVAVFAPGGSSENTDGQDTVITQPTVYLPAGTPVQAVDAVVVPAVASEYGDLVVDGDGRPIGDRYEVDGQPGDWGAGGPFGTGWVPDFPVVVPLKRVV